MPSVHLRLRRRLRRIKRRARRRFRRLVGTVLPPGGRVRTWSRTLRAAASTSLQIVYQQHKLCLVYRRGDYWVHRYRDGATVAAEPRVGLTVQELKSRAADYVLREYVPRPGDTVVDIGAGTGREAYLFSDLVGARGRVFAIEAHPETFRWLQRACEVNGMNNVEPVLLAITDSAGEIFMSDRPKHIANRVVARDTGVRVTAQTLDEFVREREITRIDLLTMNIEGAERLAIQGMKDSVDLIANVCISCHDFIADKRPRRQDMRTKDEVRQFLVDNGFEVVDGPDDDKRPWARDYLYGRRRHAGVRDSARTA